MARDVIDTHWGDYLFDDEEPPTPEKFGSPFDEPSWDERRLLSREDEKSLALRTALESICNASIPPLNSNVSILQNDSFAF
jgi:hypothetical protein